MQTYIKNCRKGICFQQRICLCFYPSTSVGALYNSILWINVGTWASNEIETWISPFVAEVDLSLHPLSFGSGFSSTILFYIYRFMDKYKVKHLL